MLDLLTLCRKQRQCKRVVELWKTLWVNVCGSNESTRAEFFIEAFSLVFFAWSIASQSPGLSGAGNKGVDPFDVYAVDGPGEQLLHITVRPNGNQVRVVQEGVLAMPGKPHGIARHPTQSSLL